jgi:hypothetical protein
VEMIHEIVRIAVLRCWLLERARVEGNTIVLCTTKRFLVSVTIIGRPGRCTDFAQNIFPRVDTSERIEEKDAEDELGGRLRARSYDPLEVTEMSG